MVQVITLTADLKFYSKNGIEYGFDTKISKFVCFHAFSVNPLSANWLPLQQVMVIPNFRTLNFTNA